MSLRGALVGVVSGSFGVLPATAAPRTIEVDSQLVDCVAVGPTKCLRVRDRRRAVALFHGQIEGFTFEPGYRYRLQVERFRFPTLQPTASSIRTVLCEIVRKLAVEPPADPFAGKVWRLYRAAARRPTPMLRPRR